MRSMLKMSLFGGALIGMAVVSATAPAIGQEEGAPATVSPWRILLEQQLREEKDCSLNELLLFDEFKRDTDTVIEGKISCIDGRTFDFKRPREHQKFEIELCAPTVC